MRSLGGTFKVHQRLLITSHELYKEYLTDVKGGGGQRGQYATEWDTLTCRMCGPQVMGEQVQSRLPINRSYLCRLNLTRIKTTQENTIAPTLDMSRKFLVLKQYSLTTIPIALTYIRHYVSQRWFKVCGACARTMCKHSIIPSRRLEQFQMAVSPVVLEPILVEDFTIFIEYTPLDKDLLAHHIMKV